MIKWLIPVGILLGTIALIPFGLIAKARVSTTTKPRLHVVHDMDHQEKYRPQAENPMFADGRAMRMPVPGTVAQGELYADTHLYQGRVRTADGKLALAETFPAQITVDTKLLERGRERYAIFCAMCHGHSGHGDGMVHQRVDALKFQGRPGLDGWAQPANYHNAPIPSQPVGELFQTVTNGKNNMAGYRSQIPVHDRWAIVAYVRALQISQKKTTKKAGGK